MVTQINFSVIFPKFRRPREFAEAIASVLRQLNATIEIFVLDDSPEGSAEKAVTKLDDRRVAYLKKPNPNGSFPSMVRNIGWTMAAGSFIHFWTTPTS